MVDEAETSDFVELRVPPKLGFASEASVQVLSDLPWVPGASCYPNTPCKAVDVTPEVLPICRRCRLLPMTRACWDRKPISDGFQTTGAAGGVGTGVWVRVLLSPRRAILTASAIRLFVSRRCASKKVAMVAVVSVSVWEMVASGLAFRRTHGCSSNVSKLLVVVQLLKCCCRVSQGQVSRVRPLSLSSTRY